MGDGGVACITLQQHTNIMERFPDKAASGASHCNNSMGTGVNGGSGGKTTPATSGVGSVSVGNNENGVKSGTGNGAGLKTKKVVKRIVKVKKVVTVRKAVQEKGGKAAAASKVQGSKEEVEEGELGTLKSPDRGEAENGEVGLREKQRKSEVEREDFNGERWRKRVVEKGENVPGKFLQKEEFARSAGEDYERELVLDRWQSKGEFGYSKSRGRSETGRDHTPPSGKFSNGDGFRRKEFSRSGSSQSRSTLRWDGGLDRGNGRIDSRIVDEEGSYNSDYSNGKSHAREHPLGNQLKRLGSDSGGIEHKRFGNYMGSKSRRVGEDGARSAQFEHYPEEKFFKNSSASSRLLLLDKYYPRNREPTLSSKLVYERRGQSPSHVERSPGEKGRDYDPRDQNPLFRDRSPYDRQRSPHGGQRIPGSRQRSPYAAERTPFGHEKGERTPYGRERSPYGGERTNYGRERSPYGGERTPHGYERSPRGGERTPFGRERSPYGGERANSGRERSPYGGGRTPHGYERSPRGGERTAFGNERSPYGGERTLYGRDISPHGGERSLFGRERSPYGRERSPYGHGKSSYEHKKSPQQRKRRNDHRARTPVYTERSRGSPVYLETSPGPWARQRSHRDQIPNNLERSPRDGSRSDGTRQASRKHGGSQKRKSQRATKGQEDKIIDNKDSNGRDLQIPENNSPETGKALEPSGADEKLPICQSHEDEQSQRPSVDVQESHHIEGPPPEELQSMEEDMDICDTPPHVPVVADSSMGKWYYLDYYGVEQGPARLCDLKSLVDDGVLFADHFIKHLDGDRWVTIEHAASPLVTLNFPSIVPDSVTQLVSPPEAPGNLLSDNGDIEQSSILTGKEAPATSSLLEVFPCDRETSLEPSKDYQIDERVGALMGGFTITPGKELETIGEALQMTFEHVKLDEWGKSEGFIWQQVFAAAHKDDGESLNLDMQDKEDVLSAACDLDPGFTCSFDAADWFSSHWACKGGDWKRNDDAVQDRFATRKLVLNDGFPLCQMPKAGFEDPRWHRKDDLYYPSQSKRLDLPLWAFSSQDDGNESIGRSSLTKLPIVRGARGTALSVVRINACVVKDHGSIVSESHKKVRGKDRHSSRSARMYSAANDAKRAAMEGYLQHKSVNDQESNRSWKFNVPINVPKDRICTVHDLQLHLGDWYYLDGAGHEQGPHSYSELQAMVDQGLLRNYSSVFRKSDRFWIPVTSEAEVSESRVKHKVHKAASLDDSSRTHSSVANDETGANPSTFHSQHPQYIGYTRGKLYELVMKAYKSREFAAAINEVLDPWISAKLPRETEKHIYLKSDVDARACKRARLVLDESDEDHDLDADLHMHQDKIFTFEELCGDTAFVRDETACSGTEMGSWGLLDGQLLARVFHFLRSDMKSLAFASLTCKHWRSAVGYYKGISRQVDFSSAGSAYTDSMIWNIMNGYDRQKISTMVVVGCTNITSRLLEQIVHAFPHLSTIDIRGCSQFVELTLQFPNLRWLGNCSSHGAKNSEESHSKLKSVKQSSEISTAYKSKGLGGDGDDFGELKEYFESVNKRDSANQLFRRSLYKRSKLFDARKSSAILSRDARMRRWAMKKSEIDYKRMEGFLASALKDIMKENSFDFFVPKVAEIEQRMKNGYYMDHGLRSVQDDIRRMCRNAFKAKNHGTGEMSRIADLFLKLASRLSVNCKFSYEREELMKSWKDDLSAGLGSTSMKYKKKTTAERRHMNRSGNSLHRKTRDSDSDTSNDFDRSFLWLDSESTSSDSESDLDFQPEGQTRDLPGDGYFTADESSYSATDEREWGARMTKASLVPPVTRKYDVIDQYVIVADEEDVQRKMSVSLPDDYAEKLDAQRNGTEELDMELPEVKEYKPRKQLGDQVIEQEVYGIDPFTHNLLLDSMPEELDLTMSEKHLFIEDMLLRTLNKQVRHFTGTGTTPMTYPLQAVIEEIEKDAEENTDIRTIKMCRGILKAIDSRPDDRYVAYRKGLGVVCNKNGGFGEDDFVVEFLGEVYPAWKWFEKQDGIRSLQKDSKDPAPEFYNIYLERPKGDADGYDLVVVDAMHKANYASRICHSCRPNCEAKVTAVDGHYQIGIYTVREIQYDEEITFDYNSVTESKEEYEASVCLCGSQVCRGSYLNLTGEGAFQKVLKELHGVLDRYQLMVEACAVNSVSEEDYIDLGRAGLGSCLLGGLPDWVVAYSASLVRFVNLERTKLPEEILKHNIEEKQKYFSDICVEVERSDAEVQAEGVYNQRLQNLAVTLDKVRYVMRCIFGDPKKAPPPLEKLSPEETLSFLWKGEGSVVEELLQCMAPHMEAGLLNNLRSNIRAHDPSDDDDLHHGLRRSLLWLRDELRSLPCTYKCRHDAAADLIHVYAYTKFFFRIRKYDTFTSPPVYISPLDLGPKYADKLGPGNHEYRKTYGENYCLGQLIFWHIQTNTEPDCSLDRAGRGCLSLPDIGSFYTKVQKPSQQRIYGPKTLKVMLDRMVKYPQKPWPKDRIWSFKSSPDVFGSPMLDAVLKNSSLDKEMVHWLKQRPSVFQALWDE